MKHSFIFSFFLLALVGGMWLLGDVSLASPPPVLTGDILPGPDGAAMIGNSAEGAKYVSEKFVPFLTNTVFIFLLSIGVILVIIGGLFYITSAGNEENATKGRETIIWAIIGTGVAAVALAIVKTIISINFFG